MCANVCRMQKKQFIGILVDPQMKQRVHARAEALHRDLSKHIRYLIEQDLNQANYREDHTILETK